ncbi:IS5 family transposase [Ralstonia solanacearum]|uniref:IS5 family transposase n=1 Tax=Ralstonia solanacearum TaxID=305 RepID=UPI003CC59890
MTRRYGLTDAQWERIQELLPGRRGHVGAPAKDNRLFVDAVLYRYRAGIAWRDLPERFGDFRVVHLRHMRWSRRGVWQRVFEALAQHADNEYAMIDATIVRAHQHSAGGKRGVASQAIGRSRGGLSTKIHATVDALGNPTGLYLTPGQASDLDGADVLLKDTEAQTVIADKGYDAQQRVVEPLLQAGKAVVIPSIRTRKVQREYDAHLYKARHLVENFFAKLKQYRAIATRYDKTAAAFLGAIHLASAVSWTI